MVIPNALDPREAAARSFAQQRHEEAGQRRKYTGEPYIVHPEAVVGILRSVPHSREMILAAWCHDLLEDTDTTAGELRQVIGIEALLLVQMVTKSAPAPGSTRKSKLLLDIERLRNASPEGKTLKLADVLDNTGSLVERDPDFAAVYLPEKWEVLQALKGGDEVLWQRAFDVITSGLEVLGIRQPTSSWAAFPRSLFGER